MIDLSTAAGQAAHYAAVRQRLNGKPNAVPKKPILFPKPRKIRVRDFLFLASTPVRKMPDPHYKAILEQVALKHGVSVIDIQSHRRDKPAYVARQEAAWRMRRETQLTTSQIGHRLGGRDHTTVIHAIRRHEERLRAGVAS